MPKSWRLAYAKHLLAQYVNMFVSQVILSGITLEPRVDQLAMIKVTLADSKIDDAIMSP